MSAYNATAIEVRKCVGGGGCATYAFMQEIGVYQEEGLVQID